MDRLGKPTNGTFLIALIDYGDGLSIGRPADENAVVGSLGQMMMTLPTAVRQSPRRGMLVITVGIDWKKRSQTEVSREKGRGAHR